MDIKSKNKIKINTILSRTKQNFSIIGKFYLIIRFYLTNNIFFYSITIFLRFISLIIISGDYISTKSIKMNNKTIYYLLKKLTFHSLINNLNISFQYYLIANVILYVLFCLRIINYFYIIWKIKNKNIMNDWPSPSKYQIIIDHILLLLFPYIIEFLSFPYYIYLYPEQINIKCNDKIKLIIIMVINTLLILLYNLNIYIFMICSNKKYTVTDEELYSQIKNNKINYRNNNPIKYKCKNLIIYILVILQNCVIFQNLEFYFKLNYKLYYKIITSIILILLFLILIIKSVKEYNYHNFINCFINILLLFCFYTIILEILLYIINYKINYILYEFILAIIKIFLSYTTNLLLIYRLHFTLKNNINEILFQEKNIKNKEYFIDSFLYLNELIQNINRKADSKSILFLLKFLYNHICICNKIKCNCKLLTIFINKEKDKDIEKNISNIIIVLNYLFESSFLDYDYNKNYEMNILLAEHFCHLRNNPLMSFSLIKTYIINYKYKLSELEMIELYELCQKYVYYINAIDKFNRNINNYFGYYINYYNFSKKSIKIKNIMNYYIDNILNILKYKNIFEENLEIKFDERNEYINFIKINFFQQNSYIETNFNELKAKSNHSNSKKFSSNLYRIIYILKLCQMYYNNIIAYVKVINLFKDLPIFIVYKLYIFFDIFEGGNIPEEISTKLYNLLSNTINKNININKITNIIYDLLKKRYNEQNNKKDSKFYAIYEYKIGLITKYFTEECSLRLGYKQEDIINKKIDELMPNEFSNSHENIIKKLLIKEEQSKYFEVNKSYIFNKDKKVLYSIIPKSILLYNTSKNLSIISEIVFIFEKEFIFMINSNFHLLSISKNFENEYSLNQKIFEQYNLNILQILNLKIDNLYQKFEKEFKIINYNNTEEYFLSQLYTQEGQKNDTIFKISHFNENKNNILLSSEDINTKEVENDRNKNEELISFMKVKKDNLDILKINNKLIINSSFSMILNKYKFIENIFKQLTKIPDNEILNDNNNNTIYKLIINSKTLINKLLLSQNIFQNDYIQILVTLKYFYDKPFYFFTIKNGNKILIKRKKYINLNLEDINFQNKFGNKSRNKKEIKIKTSNNNIVNNIVIYNEKIKINLKTLDKINKYKEKINKKRFMFIIEKIIFTIILFIFIFSIIILIFQENAINITEAILLSYYYNTCTRGIMLKIYSELNGIFHDLSGINNQNIVVNEDALIEHSNNLRRKFFYFREKYISYNLFIDNSINLLYKDVNLLKLKGFWKEIQFISKFSSDIDYISYMVHIINLTLTPELESDIKNFLFYHKKDNKNERVNSIYIQLLFYLCINYEYTYKNFFIEVNHEIHSSYNNYFKNFNQIIYILEIGALILYLLFLIIMIIYLHNSNNIIIKNLIFLFLDFSDKNFLNSNTKTYYFIRLKLFKLKYLIDDFNLNQFQHFLDEIDYTNKIQSQKIPKNKNKEKIKIENLNKNTNNINSSSKMKNYNSSYNNLIGSDSKSFHKDLNNNSNNTSISKNKNLFKKNPDNIELQTTENIYEIILNKSNKEFILIIKKYIVIIILLIIIIIIYIIIKIRNNIKYIYESNLFYNDFDTIITRYTNIHYYFITLKSLFMFNEKDQRWIDMMSIMEKINEYLEMSNTEYYEVLTHKISSYNEVQLLINLLQYNKNDSVNYIKNNLCSNIVSCHTYLDSEDNIFTSGIDNGLKICFIFINNIIMDYKKIVNKSSIEEIVSKITGTQFYEFKRLRKSFSYIIAYVQQMIYTSFENDQKIFRNEYKKLFYFLNLISLIISFFSFLVFLLVYFSIQKFMEPIKDSTIRINKSFYYIKTFRT